MDNAPATSKSCGSRLRRRGLLGVIALGGSLVGGLLLATAASATVVSGVAMPTTAPSGMQQVFGDDFSGTSLDSQWFSYGGTGGGDPANTWSSSQVQVANGELTLSATKSASGNGWLGGGISSRHAFNSEYGEYFVRMKASAAEGVADVVSMWPSSNTEPGELDFVEDGGGTKQQATGTIHYLNSAGDHAIIYSNVTADLTQWHTWGVEVTPNQLTYTVDGNVWAVQTSNDIPDMSRAFSLQTQAWSCGVNTFETCPNASTPDNDQLQVAWVVADQFDNTPTAVAAPALTQMSQTSGPTSGDTTVTLTGTGFSGSSAVDFGSQPATSFTVDSDTQITAVTPVANPGTEPVTVTTASDGTTAVQSTDEYTYVATAAVTGVSPSAGSPTGGNTVTVTGSGFDNASQVMFGSVAATALTVVSPTEITATAPAQAAGDDDVVVTTPEGSSPTRDEDLYNYETPGVTGISPATGPQAGGNTVTVSGSDFTDASQVMFGSVAAESFTVVSDTEITAVPPAQAAGSDDVAVTTPDGTSVDRHLDLYTYGTPVVTGVSPATGPQAGGNTVTVIGTGFSAASKVVFGTVAAESFTVVSDTEITAVAPAQAAGSDDVVITTPDGTSVQRHLDLYTYGTPVVTGVSPATGPQAGGNTVTVIGSGFGDGTKVMFGTLAAKSFTVVSATKITAVAPAQAAGSDDVVITTPDGTSAARHLDLYTYGTPVVTGVSPDAGPQAGGNTVTVTGTGFTNASQVMFGSVAASEYKVVSSTEITVVAPAQPAGVEDISVTTPDGTSVDRHLDLYTYATPVIQSISPSSGVNTGGTKVTVAGTGFSGTTQVLFGSMPATSFTVVSAEEITAVSPAQANGMEDIVVTTPDGTTPNRQVDEFVYTRPS